MEKSQISRYASTFAGSQLTAKEPLRQIIYAQVALRVFIDPAVFQVLVEDDEAVGFCDGFGVLNHDGKCGLAAEDLLFVTTLPRFSAFSAALFLAAEGAEIRGKLKSRSR